MLEQRLERCGNASTLTPAVVRALAEHAAGNPRVMKTTANELLDAAIAGEKAIIDEKLYFDVFHQPIASRGGGDKPRARK